MSIHPATATAISVGTPEEQRSNDLWAAALATLSDVDRQNIHFDSLDKLKVLSDLRALTELAKEECIRKRWKYTRNGKTVVLRDVFDKVLQWVEMFKNIGDVVAQHVPASVALPWAGVGFLLDVRDKLRGSLLHIFITSRSYSKTSRNIPSLLTVWNLYRV